MLPVAEGQEITKHITIDWTRIPDGQNKKCRSPEQHGRTTLKHTLRNHIMKLREGRKEWNTVVFNNYFW
jgi:hypothetical protein